MKMFLETVSLPDIDIEASPRVRSEIHEEAVEEYSRLYRDKKPMPEATLCKVAIGHYLVADGMHRVKAMQKAGITERAFDVFQGEYGDCLIFAARSNQSHGVRRTNADKRTAIESVLKTFPKKSDSDISGIVGVADTTVADVRKSMEENGVIPKATHRIGKDGKTRTVNLRKTEVATNEAANVGHGEIQAVRGKPTGAEAILDEMGLEIPEKALPIWNRRQEAQDLLTAISRIKCVVAKGLEERDPFYAEVSNTIIADLERVYGGLSVAKPYTVCPRCQGKLPDKCMVCSKRGLISKFYWDIKIDAETKKLREKVAAKTKQ